MTNQNISGIIKGVFLLILAVSGNFVAETLGCKTQKLLGESMLAKHFIILLVVYFALGFTSDGNPHPGDLAKNSLIIWIMFVLFTKMSLPFTIVAFIILTVIYVLNSFNEYYKNEGEEKHRQEIESISMINRNTYILLLLTILVGFSKYFIKQYTEYYKTWSTVKFVFGVNKCKSLK